MPTRAPRNDSKATPRGVRPLPPGCPVGLRRGTDDYRRWEAGRVIELGAAGLSRALICAQLGLTRDEYLNRLEWIRANAEPVDGLLAWTHYAARTARLSVLAEETYRKAKADNQTAAAVGALRLMRELDHDLIEVGMEIGVLERVMPRAAGPKEGEAASALPSTSIQNTYVLQILEQASGGADPRLLNESQLSAVLRRIASERGALRAVPDAPSLSPGRS